MEAQGAVIIRDDAGTEHEFPAGFDPARAAAIVRQQSTTKPDFAANNDPIPPRGWQAPGSHEMSDGPSPQSSSLMEMLGPLAHPQTLTDFARLLTLPVDSVKKAAASALAMAASRGPAGAALSATGRGLEAVGNSKAAGAAEKLGGAEAVFHLDPKGLAVAAVPTALRATGRGLQRVGAAVTGPAVAEAAPVIAEASEAAPAIRPTGTGAALPDQKALNEAALAARRAAYQATQRSGPVGVEPIVKASGKMQLTAPEFKEFKRLLDTGMKLEDAEKAVKVARDLAGRLGAEPPPVSATKFPKGMRGKS